MKKNNIWKTFSFIPRFIFPEVTISSFTTILMTFHNRMIYNASILFHICIKNVKRDEIEFILFSKKIWQKRIIINQLCFSILLVWNSSVILLLTLSTQIIDFKNFSRVVSHFLMLFKDAIFNICFLIFNNNFLSFRKNGSWNYKRYLEYFVIIVFL